MVVVELHDTGLRASAWQGRAVPWAVDGTALVSPALASKKRDGWSYSQAAAAQARLAPQETFGGFWSRLDRPDEPLGSRAMGLTAIAAAFHHLNVVALRLRAAGEPTCWLLPAGTTDAAETELKAVLREAGWPDALLLDSALAVWLACRKELPGSASQLLVADADWQSGILTPLSVNSTEIRTQQPDRFGGGLREVESRLLAVLDDLFVQQTRLRPSRKGAHEQELYQQLPSLLETLRTSAQATLKVAGLGAVVERQALLPAVEPLATALVSAVRQALHADRSPESPPVVLLHRCLSALPGLLAHLDRLPGLTVRPLPSDHAATDAAVMWLSAQPEGALSEINPRQLQRQRPGNPRPDGQAISSGGGAAAGSAEPPGLTSQRAEDLAAASQPPRPYSTGAGGFLETASQPPTHLLFQGMVLPLDGWPFLIGREVPDGEPGLRIEHPLPEIAARHCQLDRTPSGEIEVIALGEAITWWNDQRVPTRQTVQVGDYLGLGGHRLEIMLTRLAEPRPENHPAARQKGGSDA